MKKSAKKKSWQPVYNPAFDEGAHAQHFNQPRESNPYSDDDPNQKVWFDGFDTRARIESINASWNMKTDARGKYI